jgi:hypothetical protein
MDIGFVIANLIPGYTVTFKEGCEKTLSNIIVDAHTYPDGEFIIPSMSDCEKFWYKHKRGILAIEKLREIRDKMLFETDKYAIPDYPINDEERKQWYRYRQHLRDLPGMSSPDLDEDGNLVGVEWPDAPN